MSTGRFRRVAQLWNWLPSFRGVAEHESIHGAAAALRISPSALSRTVKLLEGALGAPLFARRPGGLRPTPLGQALLAATRDAMRLVDDCIERHDHARESRTGELTIGTTSELIAAVVAQSVMPTATRPMRFRSTQDAVIAEDLLRGHADVVLTATEPIDDELHFEPVGSIRFGFYASSTHPLAARAGAITDEELEAQPRVAPYDLALDAPAVVVATADAPGVLRAFCERSSVIALLPDVFGATATGLVRLGPSRSAIDVHASSRRSISSDGPMCVAIRELVTGLRRTLR